MKKLLFIILIFASCKKDQIELTGMYLQKNISPYGKHVNIITFSNGNYKQDSYLFTGEIAKDGRPVALLAPLGTGHISGSKLYEDGANFDWGKKVQVTKDGFRVYLIFDKMTVEYKRVTPAQCIIELMLK